MGLAVDTWVVPFLDSRGPKYCWVSISDALGSHTLSGGGSWLWACTQGSPKTLKSQHGGVRGYAESQGGGTYRHQ